MVVFGNGDWIGPLSPLFTHLEGEVMDIQAATERFLARGGVIKRLPDQDGGYWARLEMQGTEGFLAALGVLNEPEPVRRPLHRVGGFREGLEATKKAVFDSLSRDGRSDTRDLANKLGDPIAPIRYALTTLQKEGLIQRRRHDRFWEINPAWRPQ